MKRFSLSSFFSFTRKPHAIPVSGLFAQLMEYNNEIVVAINDQQQIVYRSPAATRITGWTNDEIQNTSMLQKAVHPDDFTLLESNIKAAKNFPGKLYSVSMRVTHKNGQLLHLEGDIHFAKTEKSGGYVLLNVRDVTDRILKEKRLAEKKAKLAEQEEQLQLYVEHSPAAIAMFDTEMRYLVASRRWKQDYRLDGKEITGISHYDLFSDISDEWKAVHHRCLQGAIEKNDEDLYIRADGSKSWLRWEVRPWHTARGSIGGIMMFAEDITERKTAEEKITASEERYRSLVERVSDGFVALDTEWKFTYVNHVAEEMLNVQADAIAGRSIWEVFPESVHSPFYKAYHEAMAAQRNVRLQGFSLAANMWVDVNAYPSPTGLSVYFRNITSEKKANENAALSQAKYSDLVARISDGFISLDNNMNFVYANSMAEKMFGYDTAYLIGKNVWEVYPKSVGGPFYKNYLKAMETQQHTWFTDFSQYAKKWLQVNIYPSPSGLTIYFRDINEQVNAEAAARKSEETRRLIMGSALDAIICAGMDGNITFWNAQAQQLFGWTEEEVKGKQLTGTIIPARYKEKHQAGFNRFLQTGSGRMINKLVEASAVNKNGHEFPIELFIVEVKHETEPFFCAFIRDISERKAREKEILKTNGRLKRAQEIAQLGSVEIDFDSGRSVWSDEACKIYGLENGVHSLEPEEWFKTVHPDDLPFVKEMVAKTIKTNASVSFYHRILRRNGEIRHVLSNGKFEYHENGDVRSMHGIVHDITELKKLEQELLEQQQHEQMRITAAIIDAEEKERNAIGEELHDNVNQILTGIFLQLSRVKSRQLEAATIVDTSMEYLKKAIEENRKISKELIIPEFVTTSLLTKFHDIIGYMLDGAGTGIQLDAATFDETILNEKQKLIVYRILQEQCTNIIKYANASTVSISLSTAGNVFKMTIADNGAGKDPDAVSNGIGLRNIKSRLSLLNGTADIITSPGNGFVLKVVFPV